MERIDPIDLIRLNLALEFTVRSPTGLAPLPGRDPPDVPRLNVSRHSQGYVLHFHHQMPRPLVAALTALGPERLFDDPEKVREILENDGWSGRRWKGATPRFWSGYFSVEPSLDDCGEVERIDHRFVIRKSGKVVARAWSVRANLLSAELAVETDLTYRRQGYVRKVVSVWANAILREGKTAFYSYLEGNVPSERLSRRLSVEWYATSLAYP